MPKLTELSDDALQGLVRISRLIGNDPTEVLQEMGRRVAVELAKHDRAYTARLSRSGRWIVWDCKSDHEVEFN